MAYCINNEDFLYITQTVSKTFSDTTGRYHYQLNNKNRLLNPDEGIISGKTGFTNKAGYCYVCAYKDKNRTLCIALLACGWPPNKNYKWSDANYLIALGKNITKNGILIINSYSMYLLPMENVIIAVLFLIGMLNFLLAVMILLLMKLICLKLFQLLLIQSRYMEALICTLIIYFMIVYI